MDRRPLLEVYMARIGWLTANSCRKRSSGLQQSPAVASQAPFCGVLLVVVAVLLAGTVAHGQVSGQFGLDILARRIPTTLTPGIALDTWSEFAMLEFGLASKLDLHANLGFSSFTVNAATNMAGPEHLVLIGNLELKELDSYALKMDGFSFSPEVWFAVPFESVIDVNNLPNSAVIPPADPLFVALRATASCSYAGWSMKVLLMFEDYNFPDPSAAFVPLEYQYSDQSFAWGCLTTISWHAPLSTTVSSTTGIWASFGATSVKGYSAAGRVAPGSLFETLSISGIHLGDLCAGVLNLYDGQLSLSATLTGMAPGCSGPVTTQTPSGTICYSANLVKVVGACPQQATVSVCLTLFATPVPELGAITLSFTYGSFQGSIYLGDTGLMGVSSLSFNCTTSLSLAAGMTGSVGLTLTGIERGLTGLSTRLSVSQGLFSAGTSVTFAQIGTTFGFASLTTQLTFRLPPGVISVQATFARNGLTQGSLSMGVVF
jgi:hypothetical protein